MPRLSVNINKIATLRNARGGHVPDLVKTAMAIERYGAEGITIHPRPDERHIRYADAHDLKNAINTELNIEGYPNKKFIDLVLEVQPVQVTLVPDPPGVLTSSEGWDTIEHASFLTEINNELKRNNIRTSFFMETSDAHIRAAAKIGVDRIELYTGPYAEAYPNGKEKAVQPFVQAAKLAHELGMGVNAGHDLSLENLAFFSASISALEEVSIGHALISDALYFGLENTVQLYLRELTEKSHSL